MTAIEKAVEKLNRAAEKEGTSYAKLVASHLIECVTTDDAANKILQEKKSLQKCMESIKNKAHKEAKGGCAAIEDQLVYKWAENYFELNVLALPKQKQAIDLDLLDLL